MNSGRDCACASKFNSIRYEVDEDLANSCDIASDGFGDFGVDFVEKLYLFRMQCEHVGRGHPRYRS